MLYLLKQINDSAVFYMISKRMDDTQSESEWDDYEWDNEWYRRLMYANGQGEFFETLKNGVENGYLLSPLYISYCNQKNWTQKTRVFKAWD